MGYSRIHHPNQQANFDAPNSKEKGFALVTMLALVPLAMTLVASLAYGLVILRKKALAQSHCIQQASILQNELKGTLDSLLKLNPRAKVLRRKREMADRAFDAAVKSKVPHLIAAATAAKTAVYLEQLALRAQQEKLLKSADLQRNIGERRLRERVRSLRVHNFVAQKMYWRALAVEAVPPASLTPDYIPLPAFSRLQQQKFRFTVPLDRYGKINQPSECSVSLAGKEKAWQVQILAANARSNWSWY